MPKKKDGGGAGRSAYVLVLREHEKQGSGYSLELAPLAASDAPQRARGGASSGAAEAEAAAAGKATGTGSSAQGSRSTREDAAGGAPSRASTREAATTTGAAPRARGHSPAREAAATGTGSRAQGSGPTSEEAAGGAPSRARALASPQEARARGHSQAREAATATATAAGRPPRPRGSQARGLDTATDVAAGGPRGGEVGGRGRDVVEVGDDFAGEAGDRILNDMRRLLFSQPQDYFSQPQLVNTDDTTRNMKVLERDREVLVPVFMSPKKKKNKKDDIWNKRQIMYGIALLGLLSFVPAIVAFLPRWALFVFAAVWGVSSIGFPVGLFGTSRLETGYSRHMGRFVFMGFCLVVIFMLYQYMALNGNSPQPEATSPPTSSATNGSKRIETKWTVAFACVGVAVMAGHIVSWARGCYTGSDEDDESESSEEEDVRSSDLLQRLLARH